MGTVNPRPRGAVDLSSQRASDRSDREQIRRLVTGTPRTVAPVAGGGVVDQAEIWAVNGTVRMLAGEGNLDYFNVRYQIPNRIQDNTVPDWITVDDAEPWRLHLTPGWYVALMFIRLGWTSESGPPAGLGPYMGGGFDAPHNDYSIYPVSLISTGRWGIATYVNFGPFFHHADDDLHVEVRPVGPIGGTTDSDEFGNAGFTFTRLTGADLSAG